MVARMDEQRGGRNGKSHRPNIVVFVSSFVNEFGDNRQFCACVLHVRRFN